MEPANEEEKEQQNLLKKSLLQQLDELQMLLAIFCSPGELVVDDYGCVDNLTSFTNGEHVSLTKKLDYRLNLPVLAGEEKVQILVELPHLYPSLEMPRIVLRSAAIARDQERLLTARVERYIREEITEQDEPYMYQVVCWLQENLHDLLRSTEEKRKHNPKDKPLAAVADGAPLVFERLWIYSHHLKSKAKRQTIIKTARDLDLSGFSRPGKPAIICVEGDQSDTQEFWRIVKSLKWQKIQVKLNETSTVGAADEFAELRRFQAGFREELFCETDDDLNTEDSNTPMSMSLFMKFLDKHDCSYIKKDIFGFHSANPAS